MPDRPDQKKSLLEAVDTVLIGWDGDGWVLDAISVADPLAWNGKHEIYSPVH